MSLKPDGGWFRIREQIVEDQVTGLTFQFETLPDGETRFRVFGSSLPFGNREIMFTPDGKKAGGGTATAGICKPTWLTRVG